MGHRRAQAVIWGFLLGIIGSLAFLTYLVAGR
jgi:hypothetical protein